MTPVGTVGAALAALLGLFAPLPTSAAQTPGGPTGSTKLFEPVGEEGVHGLRLQVDRAVLADIVAANAPVSVDVPISSTVELSLSLRPFDVLTPDSKFLRAGPGGQVALGRPSISLFRGEVAGDPGSRVYLSFTAGGTVSGFIRPTQGQPLELATVRPPGEEGSVFVRSAVSALPGFDRPCMTIGSPDDGGIAGGGSPPPAAAGVRVLTIAIDADQSFTELFTNLDDASAYIVQLIGAVSDIYIRDCNFKLVLGFSRLWQDGGEPFSADNLNGFRQYWLANEEMTGLNIVHLLSGRRDLPYGGVAYLTDACSNSAFGIDGFLLGGFPQPVVAPHLSNWDVVVVAHEIGHNLGTPHTHDLDPPIDTCAQGSNERGTIMSYCHTRMGGLLNIDMRFHAGTIDIIVDSNPAGGCLWHDCNDNGIDDLDDISAARSLDVNVNSIPDECEDCNANGVLDPVELAAGFSDINGNGVLDACEADCNANQLPDPWEISMSLADDANGDLIPDSCQPDCNSNRTFDYVDIDEGLEVDLDRNSAPDSCQDCDANGLPDWIDLGRPFNLYVGQTSSSVREYHAASGVLIADIGAGLVSSAYDVTFGPDRQLYVATFLDNRIVRIDVDSGAASDFVPAGPLGSAAPVALTFGPNGNLFVLRQGPSSLIVQYNGQTGQPIGTFVGQLGHLGVAWDIAFGPDGHLYVTVAADRILRFHGASGLLLGVFASGPPSLLNDPRGLLFMPGGDLLVANRAGNNLTRYSSSGVLLGVFNDEYPLQMPWGLALGPNGNIYVASTTPTMVRLIEYDITSGRYLRSFIRGDSALTAPTGFCFRPASPTDSNSNGVLDSCDIANCPADLAPVFPGDGSVDAGDLLAAIAAWGACAACPADLDDDGMVSVSDLIVILHAWGPCPTG